MSKRKSLNGPDDQTDINISPLIDMVFILLIFFIVTTVFVEEKGLAANTPDPTSNPDPQDDTEPVSFLIRKTGQIMYRDQEVGLNGVRGIVAPAVQSNDEEAITVNIEPEVPVHLVVAVIDECESGGAKSVTMKTVNE